MNVKTVDPVSDDLWRQLVETEPTTLFHSPEWCSVLAATYGYSPEANVVADVSAATARQAPGFTACCGAREATRTRVASTAPVRASGCARMRME